MRISLITLVTIFGLNAIALADNALMRDEKAIAPRLESATESASLFFAQNLDGSLKNAQFGFCAQHGGHVASFRELAQRMGDSLTDWSNPNHPVDAVWMPNVQNADGKIEKFFFKASGKPAPFPELMGLKVWIWTSSVNSNVPSATFIFNNQNGDVDVVWDLETWVIPCIKN